MLGYRFDSRELQLSLWGPNVGTEQLFFKNPLKQQLCEDLRFASASATVSVMMNWTQKRNLQPVSYLKRQSSALFLRKTSAWPEETGKFLRFSQASSSLISLYTYLYMIYRYQYIDVAFFKTFRYSILIKNNKESCLPHYRSALYCRCAICEWICSRCSWYVYGVYRVYLLYSAFGIGACNNNVNESSCFGERWIISRELKACYWLILYSASHLRREDWITSKMKSRYTGEITSKSTCSRFRFEWIFF